MLPEHLLILSKSAWKPTIRREHAWTRSALTAGHAVTFVEPGRDLRELTHSSRLTYVQRLVSGGQITVQDRAMVVERSTLVPPHRGRFALSADRQLMNRDLRQVATGVPPHVVATTPWLWPVAARLGATRRVVDLADDWEQLVPGRKSFIRELYKRIEQEAEEIIVASASLASSFPGRTVNVVRNATDDELLSPAVPPSGRKRLVAVGTLSERFDAPLVADILRALPQWTLDIFGQCRYAGLGDRPAPELQQLLSDRPAQARWHGVVDRSHLATVIDGADVLLLAHRTEHTRGQDSMKLYDYASRGRPVVTTPSQLPEEDLRPPHLYVGSTAAELAACVHAAAAEPAIFSTNRVSWARQNTWTSRWPAWWSAVTASAPA